MLHIRRASQFVLALSLQMMLCTVPVGFTVPARAVSQTKASTEQPQQSQALWQSPRQFLLPRSWASENMRLRVQAEHQKARTYPLVLMAPDAERAQAKADYRRYQLPDSVEQDLPQWVRAKLSISNARKTTGVQMAPLLDQHFYSSATLGVQYTDDTPKVSVWAPTATRVTLVLRSGKKFPMQHRQGVWSITGQPHWDRAYYRFEVHGYNPRTGRFETHQVTDPYSVSLSTNSAWSQFIRLSDRDLSPTVQQKASPKAPEDWVIYELHVRDFSQNDPKVPATHRGKYTAFLQSGQGMKHLQSLAKSGVTHVHLLPVFDIATIPEANPQKETIPRAPADSAAQQAAVGKIRARDGFNWGYDPLHYGVPEGSYSTHPEGPQRIREFRAMVQTLRQNNLGVIMDVVYNHTHSAGDDSQSILDKIVPHYYHRLDSNGQIQNTTCCPDTATEHRMMERLMIDTLVRWAKDYGVSGFRFDLMGHHTRQNMENIRRALDQLTLEKDGIDGKSIYLYGEGWRFGSLNAIMPEQAMHQANASGSGVGTFNDRMRDSLRGGNFDHATRSDQGFINGLYTNSNHSKWNTDTPKSPDAQKQQLINYTNAVRLSMAGNLKDFLLTDSKGVVRKGSTFAYRGSPPAAYTLDPQENINYVSAHDNYSLWDQIAAKAPVDTPAEVRARMQLLGLSAVILGQGVPFIHAGSEILRSKSGDGDSYDSGDWFNALNWDYSHNNWGKGLPPAWRNEKEWDFWRPLLTQPQFKPSPEIIKSHLQKVQKLLEIRRNEPLLRLRTAEAIQTRVRFLNAERGGKQIPGLIVMRIKDDREELLVVLNGNPKSQRFSHEVLQHQPKAPWQLLMGNLSDVKGTFSPYSVSVWKRIFAD